MGNKATRVDHSEELNPIGRSRIVPILANDDQEALASFLKIYKSDHKWVDRGYSILFVDRRAKRTILHFLQHTTRGAIRNRMRSSLYGTPATFACGHSIALIFEMFLANPDLCDFDLMLAVKSLESDRHSTVDNEVNFTLWPIRPVDPHDGLIHSLECRDYPHCLAEYLEAARENNLDAIQKFENLFQIWKFHRFRIDNEGQHPRHSVWSPLSLKAFCRMAIRRHMVNRTMPNISNSQNFLYYNYAYNVKSLRLPDNLQRFLLYYELWPSHRWTNVGVWYRPKRQRCIPCTLPRFGQGVIVKHSFIPD
ncbi:hypothetical protein P879_08321 [Paragonimus westermani]|uniref:SOCS box domain-containing protein n=1 Tax=Paragonimus westermani TaxID=34504 RepID=A0A8T0DSK8_9TREM|nr:hypothetical protein P879_08321 [Paragonimus westermani]